MSEDSVPSYVPETPVFSPSPYKVTWDKLKKAETCVRKLCLIYPDAESDRRRKMKADPNFDSSNPEEVF